MKKKLLSLVLAMAMTASLLAGCGASTGEATGTEGVGAEEETEAAVETEAAEETAEAPAAEGGVLKIGGIGPTTGGAAVYGTAVMNAAQIAVDEINAAGGVNGMTLELKFEDDECDAEKSVNAYNTLKDWNMQVLMGSCKQVNCNNF